MNSSLEKEFIEHVHSAEEHGVPLNIFYNRLQTGFDIEQAEVELVFDYKLLPIVVRGVKYSGYAQLADAFNISYVRMARCLNDMWELEDIVQYANYIDNGIIYKGKWYSNTRELAEEYRVSYEVFCKQKINPRVTRLHQILENK